LQHPELLRTLDLSQPVALMLVAILHFIPDDDDPHGVVARLVGAMRPGSYLVVSHATSDFMPPEAAAAVDEEGAQSRVPFRFRTKKEFARFLEGLELISPGIQPLSEWRAESEPQPRPSAADIAGYAAVARIG
jgi:S-adenosyl methyltransferase